jgi:SSS family solute:Na+ symporter
MIPWKFSMLVSAMLISCASLTYVLFSKIGFADAIVAPTFWIYLTFAILACATFCLWAHTWLQKPYETYIDSCY